MYAGTQTDCMTPRLKKNNKHLQSELLTGSTDDCVSQASKNNPSILHVCSNEYAMDLCCFCAKNAKYKMVPVQMDEFSTCRVIYSSLIVTLGVRKLTPQPIKDKIKGKMIPWVYERRKDLSWVYAINTINKVYFIFSSTSTHIYML